MPFVGLGVGRQRYIDSGGGFIGLLDEYSGAAAAYSLRKLSSTYSGDAIEVRRSSDNATQDIGFTSGELDTTTLSTFCSGTDGFVTTWYDQSGNGNDATQTTAANQPKIYDSSSGVITIGDSSKPSLECSTSSLILTTAITPTNFCIIHTSEGQGFIANINSYIRISNYYRYNIGGNNYISNDGNATNQSIYIGNRNGTTLNFRRNGNDMLSSPFTSVASALNIISIFNVSSIYFEGKSSEFIIYDSDQSSNFSGIETNINDFYSIYP
jgi:hypothetical protein